MCVSMCLGMYLCVSAVPCYVFVLAHKCLGVLTCVYLAVELYEVESLGLSTAFGSSMSCSRSPEHPPSVKQILSFEHGMWITKWVSPSTARKEAQL